MTLDEWKDRLSGDKSFSLLIDAALLVAGDDPNRYYKRGKLGPLLAIAQTDSQRELLEKHPNEQVRALMSARIALESWPKNIQRVERIVRMAKADGGKLPVALKYCGAHTARFSGGERVNLQNLGARGHELVNAIKNIIVAPKGHSLVIVDSASIEARGTAWVAGQDDLVADFAANADIYSSFASRFYGVPVRKALDHGGIPAIEKLMKKRRQFGKVCILGMGYGMGASKFSDFAETDVQTAEDAVKLYRKTYDKIVAFWYAVEKAFAYTAKYRTPCEMPRGLRFHSTEDCDVIVTLPCGRELKYHHVKLVPYESKYGTKNTIEIYNDQEHKWWPTWGGELTENIVQALSRDVLTDAMLRLEDRGYHTVLHCHDELVLCVPTEKAEDCLKATIEEMSRTPVWAPGLPLGAEGCMSSYYRKP